MLTEISDYIRNRYQPCDLGHLSHEEISSALPQIDFKDEGHRDLFRSAVKEYFRNLGYIAVLFPENRLKIKTYVDERIRDIARFIASQQDIFKRSEDKTLIENSQLKPALFGAAFKSEQEKRTILYRAICRGLDLDREDAILFLSSHILIQHRKETEKLDQRFEGLPKEELHKLSEEVYGQMDEEQLFDLIAKIEAETLNFSKIKNDFFERNFIKAVQKELFRWTNRKTAQKRIVITGLANYFLRQNFEFVLHTFAQLLLDKVMKRDMNATDFLKYYTDEITLSRDKKYRVPKLKLDDKELSMPNAMSILKKELERQNRENRMLDYIEKLQDMVKKQKEQLQDTQTEHQHKIAEVDALHLDMQKNGDALKQKRLEYTALKKANDPRRESVFFEITQREQDDNEFVQAIGVKEKELQKLANRVRELTQGFESKREILATELEKYKAFEFETREVAQSYEKLHNAMAKLLKEKKELITG